MDGVTRSILKKVDPSRVFQEHWRHVPRFLFPTGSRLTDQRPRLPFHVLNHRFHGNGPYDPITKFQSYSRTTLILLVIFIDYKRIIDLRKFISNGKATSTTDLRPEKFLPKLMSFSYSNFYCSKVLFRASVLYIKLYPTIHSRALAPATISVLCV